MKKSNFTGTGGSLAIVLLFMLSSSSMADDNAKCAQLTAKQIEETLKRMNVPAASVLSITPSPWEGLCEVAVLTGGVVRVFYTDGSLRYILLGNLIETKAMTNLTAARVQQIQDKKRIDLAKIPLQDALLVGEKSAVKRVVIFTDPD